MTSNFFVPSRRGDREIITKQNGAIDPIRAISQMGAICLIGPISHISQIKPIKLFIILKIDYFCSQILVAMGNDFLPQKGNYKDLIAYQKAVCIYDITYYFAHKFFCRGDRTVDQMIQAARSGKQNIVEGSSASTTSKETELKLINVAKASFQELLEDYKDYLRQHKLSYWGTNSQKGMQTRRVCSQNNAPDFYTSRLDDRSDEAIANIAITLIHQEDVFLRKLIERLKSDFLKNGGIREAMTKARLDYRNNQKLN